MTLGARGQASGQSGAIFQMGMERDYAINPSRSGLNVSNPVNWNYSTVPLTNAVRSTISELGLKKTMAFITKAGVAFGIAGGLVAIIGVVVALMFGSAN